MFKPISPVTMAAKSSASVFIGRAEVNRLVQVQGYRFFAIDLCIISFTIRSQPLIAPTSTSRLNASCSACFSECC